MSKKDMTILMVVLSAMMAFIVGTAACNPREGLYKQPKYEANIESLFQQAQECPAMLEECDDPDWRRVLQTGSECLSCKALTLLYLREVAYDWDDTLGESEEAETLTEDAMAVLKDGEGL